MGSVEAGKGAAMKTELTDSQASTSEKVEAMGVLNPTDGQCEEVKQKNAESVLAVPLKGRGH